MRLQLTALSVLALLLAAPAAAQHQVTTRVDVYTDDWITVVSPAAAASVDVTEELSIEGGYAIDILSGATQVLVADAVSSATTFSELRHESHLSAAYRPTSESRISAGYSMSLEPDYSTHAVQAGGSIELFERMSELSLSYAPSLETVGVITDPAFGESATGHDLTLGWKQILGQYTVLSATLQGSLTTCGDRIGCHVSPYRYVALMADPSEPAILSLRERHPDQRLRGAVGMLLTQGLGEGFALHFGYRLYGDSWEVVGHTASAAAAVGFFDERLLLRAESRVVARGGVVLPRSLPVNRERRDRAGLPQLGPRALWPLGRAGRGTRRRGAHGDRAVSQAVGERARRPRLVPLSRLRRAARA